MRLLTRLANWLDTRFPEKVVVTQELWNEMNRSFERNSSAIDGHTDRLALVEKNLEAVLARLGQIETAAVHKSAVQDLIAVVKALKEDFASFKTSIGFSHPKASEVVMAMLNGEALPPEDSNG